ncbi:MAG: hypothetical protein EBR82_53250 [Caulobacteraceae bacterium]|nr:hypothetical protein [Caulobacteraceae bacterium]
MLDSATQIIGHNLKFDMSWLYECGFTYSGSLYDTMIFEYITAKGQKPILSLAACAERYNLELKKDILSIYLDQKINTDAVPRFELLEYGLQDIETTYQLYEYQRKRYKESEEVQSMYPVIKLSNETLEVLIGIERNGIKIDTDALESIEQEYRKEQAELQVKLQQMVRDVMGDTRINLASPDDMMAVVYGRKVKDKKAWAELFNIGTESRGAVRKKKYLRRFTPTELRDAVIKHTEKLERTKASSCPACYGKGYIYKKKKDGSDFKKPSTCQTCAGHKVVYTSTGIGAGFKVKPLSYEHASSAGFSTSKKAIDELVAAGGLSTAAREFLEALQRLNAIDTYLTSFVGGIRKGIRENNLCHPNFNQCVTSTGRLSSSGPNFQNFPRANTFPIRRVFVSRFDGGIMCPTDFAALEYRTAVMLADCPAGKASLFEGKDRHQISAEVIFGVKKDNVAPEIWKELRQKAKSFSFAPLFGASGSDEKTRAYKEAFFEEHTGITAWHNVLCTAALTKKQVQTPSGRIFAFPHCVRDNNGSVKGKTQIVNYPVQSFASDLVWAVIIPLYREMTTMGLRSCIVLQVHDDVAIDIHPEEYEVVIALIKKHFNNATAYLTERFNYVTDVPVGYEISIGKNLMDKKEVYASK